MKILLSGANFINRGAEAMLFIAANECFSRYEGVECIIQLPEGFVTIHSLDELYDLSLGKASKSANNGTQGKSARKVQKIKTLLALYREADAMLDLSGYELSSKLGVYPSLRYLFKIYISKLFTTQVYLMPQSFGPFEWQGAWKKIMPILIRHCLKYPKMCFAREVEGVSFVKQIAPKANVFLSDDLVLQNKKIESVKEKYSNTDIVIADNSVGVIPNRRLIEQGSEGLAMTCFCAAVEQIRKQGKNAYLLCHASDDMSICNEIKKQFSADEGVVVIPQMLSCFTYQQLSAHFNYVVAARYHSIVHAYKESTPAVALGWAVKYEELLIKFDQERYLIEVKEGADVSIKDAVRNLDAAYEIEREKIRKKLSSIQKKTCFDMVTVEEKR